MDYETLCNKYDVGGSGDTRQSFLHKLFCLEKIALNSWKVEQLNLQSVRTTYNMDNLQLDYTVRLRLDNGCITVKLQPGYRYDFLYDAGTCILCSSGIYWTCCLWKVEVKDFA